jgi:hypothetical protein
VQKDKLWRLSPFVGTKTKNSVGANSSFGRQSLGKPDAWNVRIKLLTASTASAGTGRLIALDFAARLEIPAHLSSCRTLASCNAQKQTSG